MALSCSRFAGSSSGSGRVGTLCVHIDALADADALVCTPLDLASALQLQAGRAFVGFTASTGQKWVLTVLRLRCRADSMFVLGSQLADT